MVSLGCPKNLVDSEEILGALTVGGHEFTVDPQESDIIIVNTCCFIDHATQESVEKIEEMGQYGKKLIVAGCLSERHGGEILDLLPCVDVVMELGGDVLLAVNCALSGSRTLVSRSENVYHNMPRLLSTPYGSAYLKIADGCSNHCTYCVVPALRGEYVSRPKKELLAEAKDLVKRGTRELIVIAQDITAYSDGSAYALPQLLTDLCKIRDLLWIRLHYCYPERVTDELIEVMRKEPKICKYIDIPIQHCNDAILQRMGRRTSKAQIVGLIEKLREAMPDITLRTTLIAGFPGETREEFEELCSFLWDMRFERLGAFAYSPQEGTLAADMPNQIPERDRQLRCERLMEIQAEISSEIGKNKIGRLEQVLVEGKTEDGMYIGRTAADSLDIDGNVLIKDGEGLQTGDMVCVRVIASTEYDLVGEISMHV
jgi:ribosomal protein S12 methylthiotransferase